MNVQKTYTSLLTADLAAAERWYTKLLGRGPDFRPMKTLVQWELSDEGGVALANDDEIAGRGVMFLYVDDLTAERRRLKSLGIVLGDDIEGDYSTWHKCATPTVTSLRWRRRPRGPFHARDRTAGLNRLVAPASARRAWHEWQAPRRPRPRRQRRARPRLKV